MDVVKMDIGDISLYENNPRKNDSSIKKVARSIQEFGWKQPIVVDKNNVIIVGHTRYKAAKFLKLKKVPVIIAKDLTDEQVKAYRIADNRLNKDSIWDELKLHDEFEELDENNPDFDFTLLGFEGHEIDDIFGLDTDEEDEDDSTPNNFLEKPITQDGDIWLLEDHVLMCGDATKQENVEKLLEKIDYKKVVLITDPPYGISIVKNGKIGQGKIAKTTKYKEIEGDQDTELCKKMFNNINKIFDKMIIFGGNYFLDFLPASDGWIIWDKRGGIMRNNFADGEMAWCNFHTPVRIYKQIWNGMIREGEHEKRIHPTQKPVNLLANIIKDFTKRNDIILDLFGGSGSVLIACEKLKRKCCMMELDVDYCDNIIRRWQTVTEKDAILTESKQKVIGARFTELLKK